MTPDLVSASDRQKALSGEIGIWFELPNPAVNQTGPTTRTRGIENTNVGPVFGCWGERVTIAWSPPDTALGQEARNDGGC